MKSTKKYSREAKTDARFEGPEKEQTMGKHPLLGMWDDVRKFFHVYRVQEHGAFLKYKIIRRKQTQEEKQQLR